mmetsp:Transcript_5705/g.15169  ORF Transcript_5705/g.15169 Transcript_5705/m.15169 type:complete len:89 (+) Transcript_5705:936-1202(+)
MASCMWRQRMDVESLEPCLTFSLHSVLSWTGPAHRSLHRSRSSRRGANSQFGHCRVTVLPLCVTRLCSVLSSSVEQVYSSAVRLADSV